MKQDVSSVGFGVGLRPDHYRTIVDLQPAVDWFEIITEDFLIDGGAPLDHLDHIRDYYPLAMHGVSLSIGSCDALNWDYLKRLKQLMQRIEPLWISDHLCWTGVDGVNLHDLLPLPYTEEAIEHTVARVNKIQDYLGSRILLENVSSYLDYQVSEMPEWEFVTEVAERADCYILLDINNVYVNAFNHQFDAQTYLESIPKQRVKQFHLAGHKNYRTHIIDTHDSEIVDAVWDLYTQAITYFGVVPTIIERDSDIPPLAELQQEAERAKMIADTIMVSSS